MKIKLSNARFLTGQTAVLKAFFFSRLLREKILLLGFILMVVLTWFTSVVGRTGRWAREFGNTSRELAVQRGWLAQRAQIEAASKAAIEHLDPAKTYNGARLQSEIAAIAARLNLSNYSADNPQTERTSQFSVNSMRLEIRNAEYASLVNFYLEIAKQTPYIGIGNFRISVANGKHNASMRVSSVEIVK